MPCLVTTGKRTVLRLHGSHPTSRVRGSGGGELIVRRRVVEVGTGQCRLGSCAVGRVSGLAATARHTAEMIESSRSRHCNEMVISFGDRPKR